MAAAAAALLAATRKETKYVNLSKTHHFVPLAFESMGPIGSKAIIFFKRTRSSLNTRNGQPFGNSASVPALVCIALQRFNAVCVLGCFGGKQDDVD